MLKLLARVYILPIRVYQWCLSPLLPNVCRYYPSCSKYAAEAILRHGIMRGTWLGLKRLCRCHPWGGSGFDPVPLPEELKKKKQRPNEAE